MLFFNVIFIYLFWYGIFISVLSVSDKCYNRWGSKKQSINAKSHFFLLARYNFETLIWPQKVFFFSFSWKVYQFKGMLKCMLITESVKASSQYLVDNIVYWNAMLRNHSWGYFCLPVELDFIYNIILACKYSPNSQWPTGKANKPQSRTFEFLQN